MKEVAIGLFTAVTLSYRAKLLRNTLNLDVLLQKFGNERVSNLIHSLSCSPTVRLYDQPFQDTYLAVMQIKLIS
jgi:hypothetical protein